MAKNKKKDTYDPITDEWLPDNEELQEVAEESVPEEEEEADQEEQSGAQKVFQALGDDDEEHVGMSFGGKVLGGEMLNTQWVKRQIVFILYVAVLTVFYISNRYKAQQYMIKQNALDQKLVEARNAAISRSSELLQRTRESKVEEYLKQTPDSMLSVSTQPPIEIKLDGSAE